MSAIEASPTFQNSNVLGQGFMSWTDFRRLALSFDGVEECLQMGMLDFRVGGKVFATLAMQSPGFGNIMLPPELQLSLVAELPGVFIAQAGGWGLMGMTYVVLDHASEDIVERALRAAWQARVEKNQRRSRRKRQ